jgi:hypothetical protein
VRTERDNSNVASVTEISIHPNWRGAVGNADLDFALQIPRYAL